MRLSELLVALDLVSKDDMAEALKRQARSGCPLGEVLVAMGLLSEGQLRDLESGLPPPPESLDALGIDPRLVFDILAKHLSQMGSATTASIADALAVPRRLAAQLLEAARAQGVLDLRPGVVAGELRVELSPRGRSLAQEAFTRSAYVGPLPVPLKAYAARVLHQSIRRERVGFDAVARAMAPLILPETLLATLGIAINAGRSVLLYGAAGNGKTSIAERIVRAFAAMVLIPYCFEVGGQIVKVFDPVVHRRLGTGEVSGVSTTLLAEEFDPRWVPCRRPFVAAGGELSLDMLDLIFDHTARFYEAPLHVKAMNGVLLIDDFGRQLVRPDALLNRWVVPMDRRIDFLKLHTGQTFEIPFDELLLFSTNLSPADLIDPAFLRRFPYKIHVRGPTAAEFAQLLHSKAQRCGIRYTEEAVAATIAAIERSGTPLAFYLASEIPEQIAAFCHFLDLPLEANERTIAFALDNLLVAAA